MSSVQNLKNDNNSFFSAGLLFTGDLWPAAGSGWVRRHGRGFGDGGLADLIAGLVLSPVALCLVCRQTQIEPRPLTWGHTNTPEDTQTHTWSHHPHRDDTWRCIVMQVFASARVSLRQLSERRRSRAPHSDAEPVVRSYSGFWFGIFIWTRRSRSVAFQLRAQQFVCEIPRCLRTACRVCVLP